jgi:hypothetical protein
MSNLTGLGRRHALDARDKRFLIQPPKATGIEKRMWWTPKALDQGSRPHCVGYTFRALLSSGPITNKGGPTATQIYHGAQDNDEWSGTDYDGTSGRGACKYLQKLGLVAEYRWAATVEDMINFVLTTGPLACGTLWDDSMSNPDRWGFIEPGPGIERVQDGHEWLIKGVDRRKGFRIQNSWGEGWSDKGRCWLRFGDMETLLRFDGDAVMVSEVKA